MLFSIFNRLYYTVKMGEYTAYCQKNFPPIDTWVYVRGKMILIYGHSCFEAVCTSTPNIIWMYKQQINKIMTSKERVVCC